MKKVLSTGLEITQFDAAKFPTSESWEDYIKENPNMLCVCEDRGYIYLAERNMTEQEGREFESIFMQ